MRKNHHHMINAVIIIGLVVSLIVVDRVVGVVCGGLIM